MQITHLLVVFIIKNKYIALVNSNLYISKTTSKLKTIFGQIPNFRRSHKQLYDLKSILLIGIILVICGADSWNEMENYAIPKINKEEQKQFTKFTSIQSLIISDFSDCEMKFQNYLQQTFKL